MDQQDLPVHRRGPGRAGCVPERTGNRVSAEPGPLLIMTASDGTASPRRSDQCGANRRALPSGRPWDPDVCTSTSAYNRSEDEARRFPVHRRRGYQLPAGGLPRRPPGQSGAYAV